MRPSFLRLRPARATITTVLAVAIAVLLTAGMPIAIRKASLLATENPAPAVPPSASDGIDVVIAPRIQDRSAPPVMALPAADVSLPSRAGRPDDGTPFEIVLPQGWTGGEIDDFDDDAERSFRYQDEVGRYFIVNLDPAGSDFDADEVWSYRVDGDRFTVVSERRCIPGEPMCSLGDGERTIYAVWDEGGSAEAAGVRWYFRFGDEASEIGGTRVFREILESIRISG